MNKFILNMYHYVEGELKLFVAEFEKLEDAIAQGINSLCHHFKIFDQDGQCHHDSKGDCDNTYA